MPGVVSLLPEPYADRMVEARRRCAAELGVETPIENHLPHVSYQVADDYDDGLAEALSAVAADHDPFTVRTNGVAVFTDAEPLVVYVPVVRTADLSAFQRAVWDRAREFGVGLQDYYRPARWTPHVTIAPVDRGDLAPVMELLSEDGFYWEFTVDTLATIVGDAPNRRLEAQVGLGSAADGSRD